MARTSLNGMGIAGVTLLALALTAGQASGQLFENLEAFGKRLNVGDPGLRARVNEGPKGIAAADLDGNGAPDLAVSNLDGSVTVYLNHGGTFSPPIHLHTGAGDLKGILISDLTGDGLPDIAVAAPLEGRVVIFPNHGGGVFGDPAFLETGSNSRDLAAGDFDGDGLTDLAVAGSSIGLRHFRGLGGGQFHQAAEIADLRSGPDKFKPDYSLQVVRRAGTSRDDLIATHSEADRVWMLSTGPAGALAISGQVIGVLHPHSIDIGPITTSAGGGGLPDLVTAHRDLGTVEVRKGIDGPAGFGSTLAQEIQVPGGPRAVRIVDLDGDGWNDLVVVLRHLDRVVTYRNESGTLAPFREMPVGVSPRELAVADFNRDGQPDIAVINRFSSDVSILTGYKGQAGFGGLDQFYLVDGEVAGLRLYDFNNDGRADVIQLHRASGDLSVRLAEPDGKLGKATFHPMGALPSALEVVDVNSDGFADVVTANLGSGTEPGSLSVRLGDGSGGLGSERRYTLPPNLNGRLFSLKAADFDGDGNLDVAVGFFDCRLGFFKGSSDGSFAFTNEYFFVYEARTLATGDFNQDGHIDLAGAGYAGDLVVVENKGSLMTSESFFSDKYPAPTNAKFGTTDLKTADGNEDGDLDLVLASGNGAMLYRGAAGMSFQLVAATLPGTEFASSCLAIGDFDGDGQRDMVVSCHILSCVTVLKGAADGSYVPALTVDVPSGKFLAAGDLDGDGKADLVGSGEVLWTALSGHRARSSPPPVLEADRTSLSHLVINEVLAVNKSLPVAVNANKTSDWIELYNGGGDLDLGGWKVELRQAEDPQLQSYPFPTGSALLHGEHLLLLFVKNTQESQYRFFTGFKLPEEGGTLTLIDKGGAVVDGVDFPPQQKDVSYARFKDALPAFVFSLYASPGRANDDNGPIEPVLKLESTLPQPSNPVRFLAKGRDDVGIMSVSLVYRRMDLPGSETERIILYDDGMHEDGEMQDGIFSGAFEATLPPKAEVEFYVDVVDLSGIRVTLPNDAALSSAGRAGQVYSFAVGLTPGTDLPPLEISEVLASNADTLLDEYRKSADWVEIHNCSAEPVPLAGLFLGKRFPASDGWFKFPDKVLAPGEYGIVFCDAQAPDDSGHARFDIDADGDELYLVGSSARGAHAVIDHVTFGPQTTDVAWARSGCGGTWSATKQPTPGQPNLPGNNVARGDVDGSASLDITDPILILKYLFAGGPLSCLQAAEVNGDPKLDITDAIYLLNYLFTGGPAPTGGPVFCR